MRMFEEKWLNVIMGDNVFSFGLSTNFNLHVTCMMQKMKKVI